METRKARLIIFLSILYVIPTLFRMLNFFHNSFIMEHICLNYNYMSSDMHHIIFALEQPFFVAHTKTPIVNEIANMQWVKVQIIILIMGIISTIIIYNITLNSYHPFVLNFICNFVGWLFFVTMYFESTFKILVNLGFHIFCLVIQSYILSGHVKDITT